MPREVIVVMKGGIEAWSPASAVQGERGAPEAVARILEQYDARLRPLFETPVTQSGAAATASAEARELARYRKVEVEDGRAEALVKALASEPEVESAYIKPAIENPLAPDEVGADRRSVKTGAARPMVGQIPDFSGRQGYLGAAPQGIDALHAWSIPGGRGAGVRIVDIEGGWQFTHIDLRANSGGLLGGAPYPEVGWRNHGTAVLGEIGGDQNAYGIVGIAADSQLAAVSHGNLGSAGAIQYTASRLQAGDILILEMHRPGPRFNFEVRDDQAGYIAVEWWPDDYLAIRQASARGIIVVEAAGNGAQNLDDPLYDSPSPGFPAAWRNPFRRVPADSGAIIIGAGAPPSGHYGPDRSRLNFSNFGQCVDCQAWGREVVTAGYGDLHQGMSEDSWYTAQFSGTSSATPIVAGALACLQGIARQRGRQLAPGQVRMLLRETGSPQAASPMAPLAQRIGNRPDLRQLIARIAG